MRALLTGLGAVAAAAVFAGCANVPERPGWKLVWNDEFETAGHPDASKWTNEVGFVRNHEAQYYTQRRLENARVENGALVIEARKEAYTAPDGKKSEYTAASLTTDGLFSTTYGRVEVRAKLPRGLGVWPAIWMLGTNHNKAGWPKCGEIDIMEAVGHEPDKVFATVHWFNYGKGKHDSFGGKLANQTPSDDFHLYAVEWYPDRMDFFYDETKYFTFPIEKAGGGETNPFDKPHYLLLNFAVGGSWGGCKGLDASAFPQRYAIDYVRMYKKN